MIPFVARNMHHTWPVFSCVTSHIPTTASIRARHVTTTSSANSILQMRVDAYQKRFREFVSSDTALSNIPIDANGPQPIYDRSNLISGFKRDIDKMTSSVTRGVFVAKKSNNQEFPWISMLYVRILSTDTSLRTSTLFYDTIFNVWKCSELRLREDSPTTRDVAEHDKEFYRELLKGKPVTYPKALLPQAWMSLYHLVSPEKARDIKDALLRNRHNLNQ